MPTKGIEYSTTYEWQTELYAEFQGMLTWISNGKFRESSDGRICELKSPHCHDNITNICETSVDGTDRAVTAAKVTSPAWSVTSAAARGVLLRKLGSEAERGTPLHKLPAGHAVET